MKTYEIEPDDHIWAELDEVNKEIARIEESERVRAYYKENPHKRKESSDKWNKKNRNEYTRAYRLKHNKLNITQHNKL